MFKGENRIRIPKKKKKRKKDKNQRRNTAADGGLAYPQRPPESS